MPSPPTELQPLILARATELFREYGFAATSVKQIAQAAGCTNAALYYYFPEGKTQIMHEVVRRSLRSVDQIADAVGSANDLPQLLIRLGQTVSGTMPGVARELGWLTTEFPRLSAEDQQFVQGQIITLHQAITAGIARFTPTPEGAAQLSWLVICAFFGYEHLFLTLSIRSDSAPSIQDLGRLLADVLKQPP